MRMRCVCKDPKDDVSFEIVTSFDWQSLRWCADSPVRMSSSDALFLMPSTSYRLRTAQ